MSNFFLPLLATPDAELQYASFLKIVDGEPLPGRLFRISFMDKGMLIAAQVGEMMKGRLYREGIVLAIIEWEGLARVFTRYRSGEGVHVGSSEILERTFFDDFPGPAVN